VTTIRFSRNVPIDLVLETTTGAPLTRPGKPPERIFLADGGRRFYLPEASACELVMELARLGIHAGEPILICLESFQGHGDKYKASARWRIYRAPQRMGQQADGTFIVPAIPGSLANKTDGGKR
jgi:hypothetical protein